MGGGGGGGRLLCVRFRRPNSINCKRHFEDSKEINDLINNECCIGVLHTFFGGFNLKNIDNYFAHPIILL